MGFGFQKWYDYYHLKVQIVENNLKCCAKSLLTTQIKK